MKCPLCQKELLEIPNGENEISDFICQTRIKFEGKASLSHYEQREGGDIHWYLPPYQIISKSNETIVHIQDEEIIRGFYSKPVFKHVFTVQEKISPSEPDKLLKRIKLLTLFS